MTTDSQPTDSGIPLEAVQSDSLQPHQDTLRREPHGMGYPGIEPVRVGDDDKSSAIIPDTFNFVDGATDEAGALTDRGNQLVSAFLQNYRSTGDADKAVQAALLLLGRLDTTQRFMTQRSLIDYAELNGHLPKDTSTEE